MFEDVEEVEEIESRPSWKSCWWVGMTLLIIGSLLASGLIATTTFFMGRWSAPGPNQTANELDILLTGEVNRIVWVNPDGQVETMAPNGENGRLLTHTDAAFQFPAWSPDGRFIAVIGNDEAGRGVYRLSDETETAEPVTLYYSHTERPFYLYWSPDSQQISFLANHSSNIGLHLVLADGSAENTLLATGQPFYWQWAADSTRMFIHTGAIGVESQLAWLGLSGEVGDNLARPGSFQVPGVSANGRYLAYAEWQGSNSYLVIADSQTGSQQRERYAGQMAMSWSPATPQLAFINSGHLNDLFWGPLHLFNAETGQSQLLTQETVIAFFWSPDGRYLACITAPFRSNGGINAASLKPNSLSRPFLQEDPHQFGLIVVDVATGDERELLRFQPTTPYITQFLPFFDQYALSHQVWSPHSDALVLPVVEDGQEQILVIATQSGQVKRLVEGSIAFWSHQ